MADDYSELRCSVKPDGKLKAEFETTNADGSASASTSVGTPEKFSSTVVMKHRPDLKLSDSVFALNQSDVGGSDKTKSVLAGSSQEHLKMCDKRFPSF